jgi:hypothetical protein
MRRCPGCGLHKPLSEFYATRRPNALPCKECQRSRTRLVYARHPEAKMRQVRIRELADPERTRTIHRAKTRVRSYVRRGLLVKSTRCDECGANADLEAAHYDYRRPVDVRWLCRPCHRTWDKHEPKWEF